MWRIHVRGKKGEFIMSPFIFVLGELKKKGGEKAGRVLDICVHNFGLVPEVFYSSSSLFIC